MLRCLLLLHFGKHTSCYVLHFCCTSVNSLHATLYKSAVLRWTQFMLRCTLPLYFGKHASCYVVHLAWQWRYIHRNDDVCVWHHCKDGPQVEVMEKNRWCCGETRNHPKNVTFFEGVQHAFFYSHCSKTRIFHISQWKWGAKDITMI